MINKIMDEIKSRYNCKEVDAGVFAKLVIEGANFVIKAYDVEGVGRVATVVMKRLIGLWDMQSLIITPYEKDMPIYYLNRHREKGDYIYRTEVFDTQLDHVDLFALETVVEEYACLADEPQNVRWYDDKKLHSAVKKVSKGRKEELSPLIFEHVKVYLDMLEQAPTVKRTEKQKRNAVFVDALTKQGGIAIVDIFIANYGGKVTEKLCNEVLFGLK